MALDGIACRALVKEFDEKFKGFRIDKIYQPDYDELLIMIHGRGGSYKLYLSANASIPRACISEDAKGSQNTPPVFCMLLRKHLSGGKIISVSQPDLERVIKFSVEGYNELGDLTVKTLIMEIMGRHSNIILVDENDKILDSIKRVDFSVSSVRQILPGLKYENPPSQGKKNPLVCGTADFLEALDNADGGKKADKCLLESFEGISPLIAREIVYRALKGSDAFVGELDMSQKLDIATEGFKLFKEVSEGTFYPCYLVNSETGKYTDFSVVPIYQYENMADVTVCSSPATLIYEYYKERGRRERVVRRNSELMKLVTNNIERCAKKIERQMAELSDTEKKETWKIYGELITANLYRIDGKSKSVTLENYYEEGAPNVEISLDTKLSPSQNAQKYFKKYNKAKTAEAELTKQLELAKAELFYLESVEEEIEKAQTPEALAEISEELKEEGYIKKVEKGKLKKQKMSMPLEVTLPDGFTVFIGKNNKQNDYLTFKIGHNNDLWFHTKDIHGSHVVLRYSNEKEFTDEAILRAAEYAAFYSKAKESDNVPVDYTKIKFVKKPSGAKPGFVIYTNNKTVYVTPREV